MYTTNSLRFSLNNFSLRDFTTTEYYVICAKGPPYETYGKVSITDHTSTMRAHCIVH